MMESRSLSLGFPKAARVPLSRDGRGGGGEHSRPSRRTLSDWASRMSLKGTSLEKAHATAEPRTPAGSGKPGRGCRPSP